MGRDKRVATLAIIAGVAALFPLVNNPSFQSTAIIYVTMAVLVYVVATRN